MRINFNLNYSQIKFRGINDTIERIKNDIKRGETGTDSFESSNGEQTIIIENYYEKNGDNSPNNENFKSLNNENKSNSGRMAAEGAISGATTGGAIEGTKSVVETIKDGNTNKT